ncbi:MAG TPA: hypothetical protein VNF05_06060 [Acidimicrobiales bacterium]|nr:hypothetical protein [Acidimicrobiales bacterium]
MRRRDWYGSVLLAILILLAKTVEVPILGAVAAILFVLIVIDVWRDRNRVSTATTPQSPPANLSTLDPLTTLETPIKPPSFGDYYKDPFTKGEPDYSAIPTDPSKLQKKNPFPDFTEEWAESERLLQRCAGSFEAPEEVWAWVNSVYNKLFAWKPTKALEFRPDEPSTKSTLFVPYLAQALERLGASEETNRSLQSLTMYRTRLAKIEEEAK